MKFTRRQALWSMAAAAPTAAALAHRQRIRPAMDRMPLDNDDLQWVRDWLREHYNYECSAVCGIRDQQGKKVGWDDLAETLMRDGFIDSFFVRNNGKWPDSEVIATVSGYWSGEVTGDGRTVPHALSKATVKAICIAARGDHRRATREEAIR